MKKFYVIGISDGLRISSDGKIKKIIDGGKVFSGGRRHFEIVKGILPPNAVWIDISIPLEDVFLRYGKYAEIVVFASGDPLFFGFANTLRKAYSKSEIITFPAFNSLQMLVHKLGIPYNDLVSISLTGRPWRNLDAVLIEGLPLIGVLTDREKTPGAIAARMLEYGYDNYVIHIGEKLGNEQAERVVSLTPAETAGSSFSFPNNLLLQQTDKRPRPFGIPECQFSLLDGRTKMITKMPIRLLTLNMLDLRHRTTFWDIGFCTGSVSIEAKLQFPHLEITAFEIRPECEKILHDNCRKFGTPGIKPIIGDFNNLKFNDFTPPDAVFIGGHGGKLVEMLQLIGTVLTPNGIIVFNSVSRESQELFTKGIETIGKKIVETADITVGNNNTIKIMKAK